MRLTSVSSTKTALWTLALCAALAAQSVESLMNAGQELLRNGAYGQAVSEFRKVLQRDPTQFEAQHNIAFAYLQMGRYPDAVREFKRAIEMNGRSAETWANLAFAYEAMGKSDKAIEALYNSVRLDPNNTTARVNLATMYVNEDRTEEAIREFKELIRIDAGNSEAYTNLGKCLINVGKHDEAIHYLRQGISMDPGNAEAHWELGNILLQKQEDFEKAKKEYQTAISLQSDVPKYYQSLANAQYQAGNKDAAVETLERSMVYINDAVVRERIQKQIDQIQGVASAGGVSGSADDESTKPQMMEMTREGEEKERKETKVYKTSPVDISSDFEDLNADDDDGLDLEKEAKKRAKEGK